MPRPFTITKQACRSASYLEVNGTVCFDLHREVYEYALNELARLNDGMFGIFKIANKEKGNIIIAQLKDYEADMKEAAQIKVDLVPPAAEGEDQTACEEIINELQSFIGSLNDKSFSVSKLSTKGEMAEACGAIELNADVIEKAWKACRVQRNLIIGVLVTAVAAGVVFSIYRNRNEFKAVMAIDDYGTLNMDFSDQGIGNLGLDLEVLNDENEIIEAVSL